MSQDPSSHVARRDGDTAPPAGESDASQSAPESVAAGSDSAHATTPPAAAQPIDRQKTVISTRPPASPPALSRAAGPFEMGEALEGEQLGHFQLEQFVGGGGMGVVFRATDTMLGRTVAVKVVSRDQTNEDTLRRFRNEAQSAARLDHPNIARVYYVGEDKGWNYIVFEYIEGVNVRDLVEHNGPLALDDAISYTLQIAEALEHAAQRDVTHRDIKPSNILIMTDGRAKLVDMGLARLQQVESATDDLTASGVTLGTFDYISPEQARDPRNTDVRSDLYSLGCTLFFMLTARPPFPDGTVLQKLLSHSGDEPPDLSQYRPDVDVAVATIVRRMLAKLPDQRFQSPRELIGSLLLLADRLELSDIRTSSTFLLAPSEERLPWWARHLPWSVPVVLLVLFVLAYRWMDSRVDPPMVAIPRLAASVDADSAAANRNAGEADVEALDTDARATAVPDTIGAVNDAENGLLRPAAGGAERETADQPPAEPYSIDETRDAREDVPSGPSAKESPVGSNEAGTQEQPSGSGTQIDRPDRRALPGEGPSTALPPDRLGVAPRGAPQVVVVTDEEVAAEGNVIAVTSLEDALREAAQLESAPEIELRFDGVRVVPPVVLDASRFAKDRLTIRAADGCAPVLAFRPTGETRLAAPNHSMIHILGGHVSWQGTQFHLELPPSTNDRQSWSLFRLESINRLEFRHCAFTVRNVDPQGLPSSRNVSFVELIGPVEFGGFLLPSAPLAEETPQILLEDCMARGQASFVRADFAVPFSFSWEHGLFVSTQRLVDVGGMIVEPRWEHGGVRVFLRRLLAVADRGICLVRSDNVAPYPLGLVAVNCEDCLFATQATTPPTPLYVLRTNSAFANVRIPFAISGTHNYYKETNVVLRVETNESRSVEKQYTFDDLKGPVSESWYSEKSPQPATIFYWTRPLQSVDRQSIHDFIPPGIGDGMFTRALGITPSQLPQLLDLNSMSLPGKPPAAEVEENGWRYLGPPGDAMPDFGTY